MALIEKYLAPGETGWQDIAERVAGIMARKSERAAIERLLAGKKFIPNSPALVFGNLGGSRNMMACHVLEVPNSIEGIMEAAKTAALVFRSGGGIGYELSALSPHGTPLNYAPGGVASGPVSFLRVYDALAETVMEGGLRRAAQMATLNVEHPDIEKFIRCKHQDGIYQNFNLSVTITEGGPKAVDSSVWNEVVQHAWYNGEPGVVFLDNINNDNPLLGSHGPIKGVNACVTGDTPVAVADGRGAVPIKKLAEEGEDVPVYSQGPDGIEVQMGRHPRKTREKQVVYEVSFDDGSSIKTTTDHSLMLRNGEYVEVQDLEEGDSLMPFYKRQYKNNAQSYWGVHLNDPNNHVAWAPEHRLIAEYVTGERVRTPERVVHHKDYDGLNNTWDNLEVMAREEHRELHRQDMLGDSNPMRKVVSVERVGVADVYNITVDKNRNLAYILDQDDRTSGGNLRWSGIVSKNCAEVPAYDQGSCCLGHVVLPHVIDELGDWTELERVVSWGVRFLDRVIDVNHYPTQAIASHARDVRRIGVGVMGFYDLCQKFDIPFTSPVAIELAHELARTLYRAAHRESTSLGAEKGEYAPGMKRRNSFLTVIAPTGHTSLLAGVHNSIYAPYELALQMTPQQHLDLVAAWQSFVDAAISYTFNFQEDVEPADIDWLLRQAYERGIKVMSVYRNNSRQNQPCTAEGTCGI